MSCQTPGGINDNDDEEGTEKITEKQCGAHKARRDRYGHGRQTWPAHFRQRENVSGGEMKEQINGGFEAAFPVPLNDFRDIDDHPAPGMSLREYAAIRLRVPNSGLDWLDEMIRESLHNEFAATAMMIPSLYGYPTGVRTPAEVVKMAREVADAMLPSEPIEPEVK